MFSKYIIDYQKNIFEELSTSVEFEDIVTGRKGTNLIDYKNTLIPIVRTTTNYTKPAQKFLPIHYDIIENIKKISNMEGLELNNALIEIYDHRYRKMKFHSDQALDITEDSYVCIFSCYDSYSNLRKLKIKEKNTKKESEILLEHNSVIIFSTETNKNYLHKIILETNNTQNKWLGITFRLSKTYIQFINEVPYFYQSYKILRMANQNEIKKFRKLKSDENEKTDHNYSDIDYTLSVSDTLPIK